MIEPSSFDRTGVLRPQRAAVINHMARDQSQSLSIISVAFADSGFLEKNLELTKHLNPQFMRPRFLRDALKAQRCRDTGWQLYRRYRRGPAVRVETLLPHYIPPASAQNLWERRLAPLLGESWRKYRADPHG
jgi:hypothetical protein